MGVIKYSQIISLDSNIFIRALDNPTALGEKARELIRQIKQFLPTVFISSMLVEEFFVRIYKEKRDKDTDAYLDFITLDGHCTIVDINQKIALLAAKLRAQHSSLKAPDALHLASAVESGAKIFITTDKRLPRKVGKLKVKVL